MQIFVDKQDVKFQKKSRLCYPPYYNVLPLLNKYTSICIISIINIVVLTIPLISMRHKGSSCESWHKEPFLVKYKIPMK